MRGDLAQGGFQRPQGLDRARLRGRLLDVGQALIGADLSVLHLFERAFEPRGHGHLVALGGFQARQQSPHRLVDTADGEGGAPFGGIDLVVQPVQRGPELAELLGGERGSFAAAGGRLGGVLEDHAVQPVAEGQTLATRKILGDLAGFRIYALDAPGRGRTHPNRSPDRAENASRPSLVCKRGVNTRYWAAGHLLWTDRTKPSARHFTGAWP